MKISGVKAASLALLATALLLACGLSSASAGQRRRNTTNIEDITSEQLAYILFGGGLFSALGAAMFASRGGDEADLVAALRETAVVPTIEAGGGYACVTGKVACEEPLLAPRVREAVVYYRYIQVEEWEEQDRNRQWHHRERILKEEVKQTPFQLVDAAGQVTVLPGGAKLDARKIFEEPIGAGDASGGAGIGARGHGITGDYKKHRFIHQVFGIAVDDQALILGPSSVAPDGTRTFQADKREERPYVLASTSREELLGQAGEAATVNTMLMWALAALSLCLFSGGALFVLGALALS